MMKGNKQIEKIRNKALKIRNEAHAKAMEVKQSARDNWFKICCIGLFVMLLWQGQLSLSFNWNPKAQAAMPTASFVSNKSNQNANTSEDAGMLANMTPSPTATAAPIPEPKKPKVVLSPEEQAKRDKQMKYVNRFSQVAVTEMEKFGIPASITLAQGLLESHWGQARLATQNNNHFGMKCFSKKCGKGHCSNFNDDHHKDFFIKYQSAWESYRAHSKLLMGKRYKHLLKLDKKDYKGWAFGLRKAGYATDPKYAEKVIKYIETLELHKFD